MVVPKKINKFLVLFGASKFVFRSIRNIVQSNKKGKSFTKIRDSKFQSLYDIYRIKKKSSANVDLEIVRSFQEMDEQANERDEIPSIKQEVQDNSQPQQTSSNTCEHQFQEKDLGSASEENEYL